MRLLTRADDILAADDIRHEDVPTPEWGKDTGVRVQAMTAAQRLAYEQAGRVPVYDEATGRLVRFDIAPDWDNRTALVICTVVDEQGQPVFDMEQLDRLQAKSAAPLERIAEVAVRLSHLRASDAEKATARLKATTDSGSPSVSA